MSVAPRSFVMAPASALGVRLAASLAAEGGAVALLTDASHAAGNAAPHAGVARIETRFGSRAAIGAALATAVERVGPPDLIVLISIPAALEAAQPFESWTPASWHDIVHGGMQAMIRSLQALHALLCERGGTVVGIGPSLALVGARGYAPLALLAEAQRSLAKSVARQWGADRIRVHWLALGTALHFPAVETTALPQVPELGPPPPALGRVPALGEVAGILRLLASPEARGLTGTLLNADGGDWMVP